MSNDNVTKSKKPPYITIIITIFFITMNSYAAWWIYDHHKQKEQLVRIEATKEELTSQVTELQGELDQLNIRLASIKNSSDLMKRDIVYYIDQKYQRVPKVVSNEIAEQVVILAKQNKLSPELILAIIEVESSFNPMAISSKNARGLMQVMPEWAPKFNLRRVNDLHDIETGIKIGIEVLKIHIFDDAKGSIHKGLYYYVGKSDSYAPKIYEAIGKFVTFRSTIDDNHITNGNEESEVENISDTESDGDNS